MKHLNVKLQKQKRSQTQKTKKTKIGSLLNYGRNRIKDKSNFDFDF